MKELQLYECDYCHTQYKDAGACRDCEARHITPVKIESSRYTNIKDNRKGYPTAISVKMQDGTVQTYKR